MAALAASAFVPSLMRGAEKSKPMYTIGYLAPTGVVRPGGNFSRSEFLVDPLASLGWVEGKNLRWEVRSAGVDAGPAALEQAAADLLRASPDVILAFGTRLAAMAAATRTVPIVSNMRDPVGMGLAKSLERPGGNVTGLSGARPEWARETFEIARALRPDLRKIVVMHGAQGAKDTRIAMGPLIVRAQVAGVSVQLAGVETLADLDKALDDAGDAAQALIQLPPVPEQWPVGLGDRFPRYEIWERAWARGIATHGSNWDVYEGALFIYRQSFTREWAAVAACIDRILRGESPAEVPILLPDKTELLLNRSTADAIGVRIPPAVLQLATEVVTYPPEVLANTGSRARRLGFLRQGSNRDGAFDDDLARSLYPLHWVRGKNLRIETVVYPDQASYDQVLTAARQLVDKKPDVLVVWGDEGPRALLDVTRKIPIVCAMATDPVGSGFAQNLQRPGGNITGIQAGGFAANGGMIVGLLRLARPQLARIGAIIPAGERNFWPASARIAGEAARAAGIQFTVFHASSPAEAEEALKSLGDPETCAALVAPRWPGVFRAAAALHVATLSRPAHYGALDESPLIAYQEWADGELGWVRLRGMIDKLLRGADPAVMPFQLPDRAKIIVNRSVAKAIGVPLSPELLLRATEVVDG